MKFKVKKQELTEALDRAGAIISPRNVSAIMSHVLLTTDTSGLTLRTTNPLAAVSEHLEITSDASLEDMGSLALPCAKLRTLVAALPGDEVEIQTKELVASIKCKGSRRYSVTGLPADDYPPPIGTPKLKWKELPSEMLSSTIERVRHCVSDERGWTNGVLLDLGEQYRAIAIGMNRVACAGPGVKAKRAEIVPCFVPALVLRALASASSKVEQTSVCQSNGWFYGKAGESFISAVLPDTAGPDWERYLADRYLHFAECEADALAEAVRGVTVTGGTRVKVAVDAQVQVVLADKMVPDEASDIVVAETEGEFSLYIDPKFLLDSLKGARGTIKIQREGEGPLVISGEDYLGIVATMSPVQSS